MEIEEQSKDAIELEETDNTHHTLPSDQELIPFGKTIINGKTYVPQEDITSYEVSLIINLFIRINVNLSDNRVWDFDGFIKENKLDRHFITE